MPTFFDDGTQEMSRNFNRLTEEGLLASNEIRKILLR